MRFKLIDEFGNTDYLYKDRNGDWHVVTKDLKSLGLNHICNDAAMFTFALADAQTPGDIIDAVRRHVRSKWSISIIETTGGVKTEKV